MYKCVISIVAWNSEKYLKKCVDACLQQSVAPDIKVVVLDNRSSDGTRSIIESYGSRIGSILSKENTGFSGGHNQVIKNFAADYYCVLNPDVFLEPDYIANCLAFLDAYPQYGGCIGKVYQCTYADGKLRKTDVIDTCGLGTHRSYQFYAVANSRPDAYHANADVFGVDGMCPVYRGRMLDEVCLKGEYFDEYFFAYCEDQDLSWRAINKGWKFAFVHNATAYHVRTWKPGALKARKTINKEIKKMALRNHYLMLVRNLRAKDFIKASPFIFFRFAKIFAYCTFFERHTLKAFGEVAANFRKYYNMRNFKKA